MSKILNESPQSLSRSRPVKVRLASGHSIEFPADSTPEDHLRLSQALQDAVKAAREPATVQDRLKEYDRTGQTPGDMFRQAKDATRNAVLAMLGIDPDSLPQGVMLGMVPVSPTGIAKNILDMGIGKQVTADAVKPRRGMFHSFFADRGGNLIDLGDMTHDVAILRAEKDPILKSLPKEEFEKAMDAEFDEMMAGPRDLSAKLKEHKLARLQIQPSSIAIEMHHAPTPHQVDAIAELVEKNPKSKVSYDLFHGEANEFKNNVTGEEFMKKLHELYFSGKTARQVLRDTVDKKLGTKLTGADQFFGEGEFVP